MLMNPERAGRIALAMNQKMPRELRAEISKIENVGLTYLVGETGEQIRIAPQPDRLALYGVTLQQLAGKVAGANRSFPTGMVRDGGEQIGLVAGDQCALRDEREKADA
jgi:multidrug efflux pump subunit AcrB